MHYNTGMEAYGRETRYTAYVWQFNRVLRARIGNLRRGLQENCISDPLAWSSVIIIRISTIVTCMFYIIARKLIIFPVISMFLLMLIRSVSTEIYNATHSKIIFYASEMGRTHSLRITASGSTEIWQEIDQNGQKGFKMPYNRRRICEDATSQIVILMNPNAKSSYRTLSLNVFPDKIWSFCALKWRSMLCQS